MLPRPPKVELELVREKSGGGPGFLTLRRVELVCVTEDGKKSRAFPYDVLERRALDASIMVAHYEEAGAHFVYLRSAIRPPVRLRPLPPAHSGLLWEVPAGLIEPARLQKGAPMKVRAKIKAGPVIVNDPGGGG